MTNLKEKPVPFKKSDAYKVLKILKRKTLYDRDDIIWCQFDDVDDVIAYLKVCGSACTCNLNWGENGSGTGFCITRFGKIVFDMLNDPDLVNPGPDLYKQDVKSHTIA